MAQSCRSCREEGLQSFLDLGEMPLADALLEPGEDAAGEARFPLEVALCPSCALVQVLEDVPPEKLFVENYLYFSSFSDRLLRHASDHADALVQARGLGPDSLVVEVASNDGYLLRNFARQGVRVLGVDPAPAQATAAEEAGVPTLREFFDPDVARRIRAEHGPADVIVANNVMAHTPDPNGMAEGLRLLLADDGVATVENAYVRDLIDGCEFDTIYHEHFSYYSCTSVDALLRRHGLAIDRVEHLEIHGGSLRWWIVPGEQPSVEALGWLHEEAERGLAGLDFYADFGARVRRIREELLGLLRRLRAEGARIAAYGAAAKGSTMVNFAGIDGDLVEFVVDRNVHKQGRLMPGAHLPIRPTSALLEEMPDYVLLLAWNFQDEIAAQQQEYLRRGGRFIVPVPRPEVV